MAAATRAATSCPAAPSAGPPSSSVTGSGPVSAAAAASTAASSTRRRGAGARGGAGPGAASQPQSAGTTSVATPPGGLSAAAIASAQSAPAVAAEPVVRTHADSGRAIDSMSVSSGALNPWWARAWSPTSAITGACARLALWRLAPAFASPGPRCSSASAGRPVIRAQPSAAPLHTPSNRPSTGRTSGTASSARTRWTSVVPALAKQTPAPAAAAVRTMLSAPSKLGPQRARSLRVRVRSSCFSTTVWIRRRNSTGPVAFTVPDANASRHARIGPSSASSLNCARGIESRTLASEAMSRVTRSPGHLDAEELDVAAAAQLELDHELELLEGGDLGLEVAHGPFDQGLGVRRRHRAQMVAVRRRGLGAFERCLGARRPRLLHAVSAIGLRDVERAIGDPHERLRVSRVLGVVRRPRNCR